MLNSPTGAETIWLLTGDGRAVPAYPVAFDSTTGFGLVQALGRLDLPVLEFGDSNGLVVGAEAIVAAGGGRHHAIEAKVVGRQEFAGYWEYLIDNAIFTAPAHPFWSGAALIGRDGRLLGTGSLILQQGSGKRRTDEFMRLISRSFQESNEELKTFMSGEFDEIIKRFDAAILRAVPGLVKEELFWRMTFLFGALHHGLERWTRFESMPIPPGLDPAHLRPDIEGFIQRFITFAAAGMRAAAAL